MAYLFDRDHDREAMLATGPFGVSDDGNLYAAWNGRHALPYLDTDGRPVYAISRATDPVRPSGARGTWNALGRYLPASTCSVIVRRRMRSVKPTNPMLAPATVDTRIQLAPSYAR